MSFQKYPKILCKICRVYSFYPHKCRAVGHSLDPEDLRDLKTFDGNAIGCFINDVPGWKMELQQPHLHRATGFSPS